MLCDGEDGELGVNVAYDAGGSAVGIGAVFFRVGEFPATTGCM
jgi:hypothetical protein